MTLKNEKEPCNEPICDKCLKLIDNIFQYSHAVHEVGIIPKKCVFCFGPDKNDAYNILDATNGSFCIIVEALEDFYDGN